MENAKKKKTIDFSKFYPLFFTIVFVVILFQYSFASLEAVFYDFRVRYDFGINFQDDVVIITMDEESDEFLGETYPYTYASQSRMFKKLNVKLCKSSLEHFIKSNYIQIKLYENT